jgi:hypothetical protein
VSSGFGHGSSIGWRISTVADGHFQSLSQSRWVDESFKEFSTFGRKGFRLKLTNPKSYNHEPKQKFSQGLADFAGDGHARGRANYVSPG